MGKVMGDRREELSCRGRMELPGRVSDDVSEGRYMRSWKTKAMVDSGKWQVCGELSHTKTSWGMSDGSVEN